MQQNVVGYELSLEQKAIFEACNRYPECGKVAQLTLRLSGALDVTRLQRAVRVLIERHESLRTSYRHTAGMRFPVQTISEDPAVEWQMVNLSVLTDAGQNEELQKWLDEKAPVDWKDDESHACTGATLLTLSQEDHILLVSTSILSADRNSLHIIAGEIFKLYAEPETTLEPAIQYADYAQWQADHAEQADKNSDRATDPRDDSGATRQAALPFSKGRADLGHAVTGVFTIALERELRDAVAGLAPDPETSIQALWQTLLWRLNGQSRFELMVTREGRDQDELKAAVGCFEAQSACVADLQSELTFPQVLGALSSGQREQTSFHRNASGVGFRVQQPHPEFRNSSVAFKVIGTRTYQPPLDLELRWTTGDQDEDELQLMYDRSRFWSDGAERIGRAFVELAKGLLRSPEAAISKLPLMDGEEMQSVIAGLQGKSSVVSADRCIHQLFEEQVKRRPAEIAVRSGDDQLTFEELNERANRLAHSLREKGVGANVPVGLCTDRSTDMIVGLLSILKAGGCYVPLAPDQPASRLQHQVSQTGARFALTQEKHRALLSQTKLDQVIYLDAKDSVSAAAPVNNLAVVNKADDLAYILFTSGSTGTPKGVAVRHSNLLNYSEFILKRLGISEEEPLSFATVSTIAADLGNTSIFPALISGGCLHVIPYETALSAALFSEYLERHAVDVLKITPSHLNTLMEQSQGRGIWPRAFLILGGEAFRWSLLDKIRQTAGCRVINHYGPTEATIGCCTFDSSEDVSAWTPATLPIGRPIDNTALLILDEHAAPAPVGVPGELYIAGAGLAAGYFRDAEQTQAKFVSRQVGGKQYRLYRTGDRARALPDGNIEFLGRTDHQLKIRGYRVEPAEIESALQRHPRIQAAMVLPMGSDSDRQLMAFVIPETAPSAGELRDFLAGLLPDYMIPGTVVRLASWPLNRNGKIDLQALHQLASEPTDGARAAVAPRTEEEVKLAAIWTEVLKRPCTDIHANFFALGGHSLLAAQIVARIRDTFRVHFPLHVFLQTPTVAELVPKIAQCPAIEPVSELDQLLATLEGLSDEEAEKMLAQLESGAGALE